MTEFIVILLVTAASVTILALIGQHIEQILRKTELLLTYLSAVIILFLMVYVLLEVLMRYAFNSPLPGHLEGAELLLPMIVFFAISYTQARNGQYPSRSAPSLTPNTEKRDLVSLAASRTSELSLQLRCSRNSWIPDIAV